MTARVLMSVLAGRVRKRRLQQGLTQEQLAKAAKVARTQVVNIEAGASWISAMSLARIANALETEPWKLLKP